MNQKRINRLGRLKTRELEFDGNLRVAEAVEEEASLPAQVQGDPNQWKKGQGAPSGREGRSVQKKESVFSDHEFSKWDREHFVHTRKIVWAACTKVGAEDQDSLLEVLEKLSSKQIVADLQGKNEKLKEEVKRLKEELEDERKANIVAATKISESLEIIWKMEGVV